VFPDTWSLCREGVLMPLSGPGPLGVGVAADQVRGRLRLRVRPGQPTLLVPGDAADVALAHHAGDALAVHSPARAAQFGVDARDTVGVAVGDLQQGDRVRLIGDHYRRPQDAYGSWQGCDLDRTGVTVDGSMDFSGVAFSGGRVFFTDARFSGRKMSFGDARFSGGTVSFSGARFTGGEVSFRNVTRGGPAR
jgi:hypothetical protein